MSARTRGDEVEEADAGVSHRLGLGAALLVALTLAVLLVLSAAGSALAQTGHVFHTSLVEAPPGTPLLEPEGVAVDAAGKVFVIDTPAAKVDVFSSTGTYLTQFALVGSSNSLAVDSSTGDVYVADSTADAVEVFKPNGSGGYELVSKWTGAATPEGAFGEVAAVAVNGSAGKVYVVDASESVVDVFKTQPPGPEETKEGKLLGTLTGAKPALEAPSGIALDPATGKVYVADSALDLIEVFNSSGAFEAKLKGTPKTFTSIFGIAVESGTGDVYVSGEIAEEESKRVEQYKPSGSSFELVGSLTTAGGGLGGQPHGLAVAPSGDVYVADTEKGAVEVFGPSVLLPTLSGTKVSAKSVRESATSTVSGRFEGKVNPEGVAAEYLFEYGETEAYGTSTTPASAGSGSSPSQP